LTRLYSTRKKERKSKMKKQKVIGTAWCKNGFRPITSAREIKRGKNKGKYEVFLIKHSFSKRKIKYIVNSWKTI